MRRHGIYVGAPMGRKEGLLITQNIAENGGWTWYGYQDAQLIASILKQAHEDYTKDESCPEWCQFKDTCKEQKMDNMRCDARKFIHSAWCATLCEGINIDQEDYIKACIEKHRLSKNIYRYVENEIS